MSRKLEQLKKARKSNIAEHVEGILHELGLDLGDPNFKDTPKRVAEMFVDEIFKGLYVPVDKCTAFPCDTVKDSQTVIIGPIPVRSMCAHHLMPIHGKAYVAVYLGSQMMGLSKYARIVEWASRRPTVQETLTQLVADTIIEQSGCKAVGVIIDAAHMCMSHRGAMSDATTATSVVKMNPAWEVNTERDEALLAKLERQLSDFFMVKSKG